MGSADGAAWTTLATFVVLTDGDFTTEDTEVTEEVKKSGKRDAIASHTTSNSRDGGICNRKDREGFAKGAKEGRLMRKGA